MKSLPLILALAFSTAAQAGVDIQRWTTGNGTEVLLVEQHDNPIVDMQVNFKGAGSVFNPEGKSEVAEFTAALLTDGTEKLDEESFNAAADDIAAQIDSSSGQESSAAVLRSLSRPETLKKAAGLLHQSLTPPRFDPAVFDRREKEAVTTLQQQETTPDFTAGRALTKLAYPDRPYGRGANVTAESIRKVNLDDIRAFHRSRYGKDNAIVAIVGDINRKQADQLVKNVLNGLPDRSKAAQSVPTVKPNPAQRRDIPFASEQAQVLLGMPLIKRHDPDYYALVAGNYILGGGGFDSRLMKVLRDRYGYTYGVYSNLEPATEAGMFTIAYSTQKKNTKDSLVQAQAVIKQFIEEGPTEEELAQAKANIIGSFPLRFDSNAKLVKYLSIIGYHNLPNDYLEAYPKAIGKLTVAQVKDAWKRRVKPEDLHIVVVGAE